MKVQYIQHMGSDRTVLNAARASFDKADPEDAPITERDKSLLLFLARGYSSADWAVMADKFLSAQTVPELESLMWQLKNKATHFIPFCHPQLSFRITAPLAIARQLWKSHIGVVGGDTGYAAWSEESRRYLADLPELYFPDTWRRRADNVKQGSSSEAAVLGGFALGELKNNMLGGLDSYVYALDTCGIAPEQARFFLPGATEVTWVWTGSLMFFARICGLRLDSDAQKEAGLIAAPIAEKCEELFPYSWQALMKGRIEDEQPNS